MIKSTLFIKDLSSIITVSRLFAYLYMLVIYIFNIFGLIKKYDNVIIALKLLFIKGRSITETVILRDNCDTFT